MRRGVPPELLAFRRRAAWMCGAWRVSHREYGLAFVDVMLDTADRAFSEAAAVAVVTNCRHLLSRRHCRLPP
jgi:hypothetical protein